ncbi:MULTISPECIES: bifunctional diaminohydroxyphosphoribosylaminopyrimidine deaminase/5-amino-6-(5-phosphoribosylamino)uracil reductase RibD [unclassified Fusibacter]|uniref:bifunctional diaminohydroxyphosphoribosylaminopyrimidine deaminase/5-amino-6-(5-phosphoribosylamino)uracil reductase RibD n=1 Tax=unclassified Fusibacter TaxID=2624464 RepID=UPI001FAA3C80|nr:MULTISPECIES: bifunctional diaminohydroxyphosphoribosylaminopyrimidine deaminase/5-amino-6-(5-phosphoribosylamino)uracil reductase RibD [unclassified Fusibacter]MCK8060342.1 bifunctional diaminohydroxyphosphoribosylaminopyrimidine deaminase/5-amino-6-(5-phosphoribosylamino)uracil reductase RibD [Fusibacter sp. A2]
MQYMKQAIALARLGTGYVNPNPLVGAVIVKNNRVIGRGYHKEFGGPHAEVNAVNDATEDLKGATIYVTLEPCSHYGKTPPCVDLIIEKGFSEVVIGLKDPNPLVAGKGIKKLEEHGIKVTVGMLESEIRDMNRYFLKYILENKPYVTMKTAMTLDGKIATKTGDSKWISCARSREHVHAMRHDMMGIMVGIGTVLADDPSLTTRLELVKGLNPRPIIVDAKGRLPLDAKLLSEHQKGGVILATTELIDPEKEAELTLKGIEMIKTPSMDGRVDLDNLMERLYSLGIDSVLLEGGSTLNAGALTAGIVDEVISFIAPKVVGGYAASSPVGGIGVENMSDATYFDLIEVKQIEDDVMVRMKVRR